MALRLSEAFPAAIQRALTAWVNGARRAAWAVVAASLVVTAGLSIYTAKTLRISTETTEMLSPDLPFRRVYEDYKAAFPYFSSALVIVVDGESVDKAEDAAAALYDRLRTDSTHFKSVFYPAGDRFFRENGLLFLSVDELADVADRMAEAQPLLSSLAADPSLRGLFDVLGLAIDNLGDGGEEAIGLDTALDAISATVEARADRQRAALAWRELLAGGVIERRDRRRLIVAQPKLDWNTMKPAGRAMSLIRATARDLGLTPESGVRVRLTGSAAIGSEELESVSRGAALAGIISLVVVSGLLIYGLRSFRLVVAVLATLIMGLIATAGFATAAVGSLNLISVAFAVLFIGLGVDFGIHFALRYKEAVDHGEDQKQALGSAATGVGGALTLSAAAAAVAFFSFLPTDYLGVAELGLIAGVGMFIALFANLTVLPALITLMPLRPAKRLAHRPLLTIGAERFIRHHAGTISVGALVLGLAALTLAPQVRFDYNPLNLKDFSTESMQTMRDLMQDSKTSPYSIAVVADNLDKAAELAPRLAALDTVDRAVTLRSYVPKDQDEKLDIIDGMKLFMTPVIENSEVVEPPGEGERQAIMETFRDKLRRLLEAGKAGPLEPKLTRLARALERFRTARGHSEAALKDMEDALLGSLPRRLENLRLSLAAGPVDLGGLPEDIRRRQIAADGRARIEVYPKEDIIDNQALRRFVSSVRKIAPEATASPVLLLEAGDAVVGAFAQAAVTALILISLLLLALLRRILDVLLVLAPLALAASLTVAASVLLGLNFNFANIIVLPLLLGLGVATGIHIVMRARREQAVTLMRTSTPRAVIFSALTTVGSFGSLSVSSHRGTASMGELLTIAITFTLVCSLAVLPALMEMVMRRRAASAT